MNRKNLILTVLACLNCTHTTHAVESYGMQKPTKALNRLISDIEAHGLYLKTLANEDKRSDSLRRHVCQALEKEIEAPGYWTLEREVGRILETRIQEYLNQKRTLEDILCTKGRIPGDETNTLEKKIKKRVQELRRKHDKTSPQQTKEALVHAAKTMWEMHQWVLNNDDHLTDEEKAHLATLKEKKEKHYIRLHNTSPDELSGLDCTEILCGLAITDIDEHTRELFSSLYKKYPRLDHAQFFKDCVKNNGCNDCLPPWYGYPALMSFNAPYIEEDAVRRWDDTMKELTPVMDRFYPGTKQQIHDMITARVSFDILRALESHALRDDVLTWDMPHESLDEIFNNPDYWDRYGKQCQRVFELNTGTETEKVIKDAVTRVIIGRVCPYEIEFRYDRVKYLYREEREGAIRLLSHNSYLRKLIGDYCQKRENTDYWPAVNADWPALNRERIDHVDWDRLALNLDFVSYKRPIHVVVQKMVQKKIELVNIMKHASGLGKMKVPIPMFIYIIMKYL